MANNASLTFHLDDRHYGIIRHRYKGEVDYIRTHRLIAAAEHGTGALQADTIHHGPIEHPIANYRENLTPMSYQEHLSHHNGISDAELVGELSRLAQELGKTPTADEMQELGRFSKTVYTDRFGTWNGALSRAGLAENKTGEYDKQDVINAIQSLADELGRPPTFDEMDSLGELSTSPARRLFGSWTAAKKAAGVE